jgi:hypothetical protein
VLLLTPRLGAAGLNLTAANHVMLCEALPNAATEEQAVNRVKMGARTHSHTKRPTPLQNQVSPLERNEYER